MSAQIAPQPEPQQFIEVEVPALDFTQPKTLKLKKGDRFVYVELRPRTVQDIVSREKAIRRESAQLTRGETEERFNERAGNEALFDRCVTGGRLCAAEGDTAREYTREECLRFTAHDKDRFIRQLLCVKTSVLDVNSDGDPMLDTGGEARVQQVFGDPANPDHVIEHTVRLPNQRERDEYESANRVRVNRGGDKPIYKIVSDTQKAYSVSRGLLVSTDRAVGEVDPWCILEAVRALFDELDKDDESFA